MLPFPLPNKDEGDGLGAAHVNALSAVANNSAAMHTSTFGVGRQGGSQSPLPPFVQRRVVVTAENFEDDENYLTIKMLYFDPTEEVAADRWKLDEEGGEYQLDPLDSSYTIDTELTAYWDDQRGAFVPLAAGTSGQFAVVLPTGEPVPGIGATCDAALATVVTASCGSGVQPGDVIAIWDLCRNWLNAPPEVLVVTNYYVQYVKIHESEYNRPPSLTGTCRWAVTGICCAENQVYEY